MQTGKDKIRFDNKLILNLILFCVFAAYLVFNGILLSRHEPWRDEANVWLMARELSPIELFAEIRYQGHPCLWYLIVMPFAKAGLPFWSIGLISYFIMAVTAGIYLFKAPVHPAVKGLSLFCPAFSYFYADIARNYCLIALILILLAVCYPKRNEKSFCYGLLLGLLVQADTIAMAAAGMISLMWLCENLGKSIREKSPAALRRILKGIWIPPASLFLWIAQFYRVSDSAAFQMRFPGIREFLREMGNYSLWILERLTGRGEGFCGILLFLFLFLFLAVSVRIRNPWAAFVMISAYLFEAVFSVMVYQLHIWHFIAICFVLIWALWVLAVQRQEKGPADRVGAGMILGIQMLFLTLCIGMFMQWNSEEETSNLDNALHGLYSDGRGAAEYMERNIGREELVFSSNVSMASTVLAWLPGRRGFYFAGSGERASYADYNEEQEQQITVEELLCLVRTKFGDRDVFYLLDSGGSCITDGENLAKYEVLYRTREKTARGEEYTIYRIPVSGENRKDGVN